jgi:hypothetical protein
MTKEDKSGVPHSSRRLSQSIFDDAQAELWRIFTEQFAFRFNAGDAYRFPFLSHKPTADSSSYHAGVSSTVLQPLFSRGTDKFFYHTTSKREWIDHTLFASQRLHMVDGTAQLTNPSSGYAPNAAINESPDQLEGWIEKELIPAIISDQGPFVGFVLGDPGSGKSTVLKYALNVHRTLFRDQCIVVTRFEALKFRKFARQYGRPGTDLNSLIRVYMAFILARDLLLTTGYRQTPSGAFERADAGPFSRGDNIWNRLERVFSDEVSASGRESEFAIQREFENLSQALGPNGVVQSALLHVHTTYLRGILRSFSPDFKYLVIFDGLDFISVEDSYFNKENYALLSTLVKAIATLGAASLDQGALFPIDFSALFVLRQNTYVRFRHEFEREVRLGSVTRYHVAALDSRAAIYNAIVRGGGYGKTPVGADGKIEQSLYKALDLALRYISIVFGIRDKGDVVLALFNNNLRDCYRYAGRLLDFIIREGKAENMDIDAIIEFLSSYRARRIVTTKGYRLVEFLLFQSSECFQNALVKGTGGDLMDGDSGLHENLDYDGYVDNIFNYHAYTSAVNADCHCIIEKIRVLQCLDEEVFQSAEMIGGGLQGRFGYTSSDGYLCERPLRILLKGGMLEVDLIDGAAGYRRTKKGTLILQKLMMQLNYIEHIFHRTLLPSALAVSRRDVTRAKDADQWALQSIRNVRFVEDNKAGGVSVQSEHRIVPVILNSVKKSVDKMLVRDFLGRRFRDPGSWLVFRALDEIRKTKEDWERVFC